MTRVDVWWQMPFSLIDKRRRVDCKEIYHIKNPLQRDLQGGLGYIEWIQNRKYKVQRFGTRGTPAVPSGSTRPLLL